KKTNGKRVKVVPDVIWARLASPRNAWFPGTADRALHPWHRTTCRTIESRDRRRSHPSTRRSRFDENRIRFSLKPCRTARRKRTHPPQPSLRVSALLRANRRAEFHHSCTPAPVPAPTPEMPRVDRGIRATSQWARAHE